MVIAAAATVGHAQQVSRLPRIGLLIDGPASTLAPHTLDPFREGLRQLGYVERQNILIEPRWSDNRTERLPDLASELVRLNVDVDPYSFL